MMEYTDRHCRFLLRLLSKRARLYTEMVTATALSHAPSPARFLDFDPTEHPIAVQLGGSNPRELARAARLAYKWGYDEINLNVGCPSERVTSGRFGACLMAEPGLVADCVKAMRDVSSIPITVKTRIGIDDQDEDHHLDSFINTVAAAGCETFIVHARKAWLKGLSPKENREIPPLNYQRVFKLKRNFQDLEIILNGGIENLQMAKDLLTTECGATVNGVMLGRSTYNTPFMLADVDQLFFAEEANNITRSDVVARYIDYARTMIQQGTRAHHIYRHIVNLYHGCARARLWRQSVTRISQNIGDSSELIGLSKELDSSLAAAA